jgi:ATP-dependent DNA helicase 2 subunit 2
MVALAPFVEPGFESLIQVELPFAEDFRRYKFPPLDKVVTVGGKHIFEHRTLPSDSLKKAMSDYVDAMDLSTFGKDENGYDQPASTEPSPFTNSYLAIRWNMLHSATCTTRLSTASPKPSNTVPSIQRILSLHRIRFFQNTVHLPKSS